MAQTFQINEQVKWNHGRGTGEGRVVEVYKEKVTKEIKGATVTRNANDEEPAYLVEQDDGDQALKSQTELDAA